MVKKVNLPTGTVPADKNKLPRSLRSNEFWRYMAQIGAMLRQPRVTTGFWACGNGIFPIPLKTGIVLRSLLADA